MLLLSSATKILATERPPRDTATAPHTTSQLYWNIGSHMRQREPLARVSEGEYHASMRRPQLTKKRAFARFFQLLGSVCFYVTRALLSSAPSSSCCSIPSWNLSCRPCFAKRLSCSRPWPAYRRSPNPPPSLVVRFLFRWTPLQPAPSWTTHPQHPHLPQQDHSPEPFPPLVSHFPWLSVPGHQA